MKAKKKILVVDDDANLRKTLADILKVKGYETAVAANGAEAIAAAEREMFSLMLIDLMLPDMSGLEVMARIKAISPLTEAIILTGHASMDTAIEATGRGRLPTSSNRTRWMNCCKKSGTASNASRRKRKSSAWRLSPACSPVR